MRKRLAAVGLGMIFGANAAVAQPPQFPVQPQFPPSAAVPLPPQLPAPKPLPPALLPPGAGVPTPPPVVPEVPLPHPEQKFPLRAIDVTVKRAVGGWQVWEGQRMLRDVGENETNARDLARVFRDLRPTEWATIGGPKPVVEYGLTNGKPAVTAASPDPKNAAAANTSDRPTITAAAAKTVLSIDLRTARVEPIKGVWCVRDDDTLLFNFGPDKAGAEQAIAVVRKYGFNRVGVVGDPRQPVMSYLFVSLEPDRPKAFAGDPLLMNAQIDALTRTGIPVPGVGYTGEMVKIDPKKVEARKDGAEWVVACGSEVFGRFGPTEWAAREAARTVQDAKFTEYCRLDGTSGITFFLRDGKPPARALLSAQGRAFDPVSLKAQQINGKWAVTEGNRPLFDVSGPQEGEVVVRVLKAYGFDQLAHLSAGAGQKGGVRFLVKNR